MSYIELYNDKILDTVSVGKTSSDFNQSKGDYIKVQVFNENSDLALGTLYSNRLLLKYPEADEYYLGNYHYHPENPEMGFCEGRFHTNKSMSSLKLETIGNSIDEPMNKESKYKKQVDIFKDDNDNIYIKPNEIIKLLKLGKAKFIIRIYFLRNIKSSLGLFLNMNKNNLIENGNFLAGLEATQTGDLDRSIGRNNFTMMDNPGKGKFVLEQDGLLDNIYDMRITGVEQNTEYVFSCMVAWTDEFNGGEAIAHFTPSGKLPPTEKTDDRGSWTDDEDKENTRVLSVKTVDNLIWKKIFYKVFTDTAYIMDNTIRIKLGNSGGTPSDNPFGRRYFTDLKFEKVAFNAELDNYLNKFKLETSQ